MKTFTCSGFILAIFIFGVHAAYAQDINYTPFDATPLVVNPAFTGMFDGKLRANGIYRRQWGQVDIPYVIFGTSVDLPIVNDKHGNCFAAGGQVIKEMAGDGNLSNFSGLASVAYHRFFRSQQSSKQTRKYDLAAGLQIGYIQQSIDLSNLYFGRPYSHRIFIPGSPGYQLYLGNTINRYVINAGLSFSQSAGSKLNYTISFAGNNLNQPDDKIDVRKDADIRYSGLAEASWLVNDHFVLRPVVFFQNQASFNAFVAGNEFQYALGKTGRYNFFKSVFIGVWYRTGETITFTAGTKLQNFRIGLGYDGIFKVGGPGGAEAQISYMLPNRKPTSGGVIPNKRS